MRLIKLAMLALFGYALYEFFRGMMQDSGSGNRMNDASAGGGQAPRRQPQQAFAGEGAAQNITGPGEGVPVATLDRDGGSVRHTVGRGVVRR